MEKKGLDVDFSAWVAPVGVFKSAIQTSFLFSDVTKAHIPKYLGQKTAESVAMVHIVPKVNNFQKDPNWFTGLRK
jgi:hypothetical protein